MKKSSRHIAWNATLKKQSVLRFSGRHTESVCYFWKPIVFNPVGKKQASCAPGLSATRDRIALRYRQSRLIGDIVGHAMLMEGVRELFASLR